MEMEGIGETMTGKDLREILNKASGPGSLSPDFDLAAAEITALIERLKDIEQKSGVLVGMTLAYAELDTEASYAERTAIEALIRKTREEFGT